jgi:hypothetical protein
MHVTQLLHPLALAPDVEIVKAMLPYVIRVPGKEFRLSPTAPLGQLPQYPARESLLNRLHDTRRIGFLWFADQQVDVLRHDYEAYDYEGIALPHLFEHTQEQITPPGTAQPPLPMIATAGDEVQMLSAVVALEVSRHTLNVV